MFSRGVIVAAYQENEMEHIKTVDLSGLCCAQPIIKITAELKPMPVGDILLAVSDKVSMLNDVPAYCQATHNPLIQQSEENGVFKFWIRKENPRTGF